MLVTISELKMNPGKYIEIAATEPVYITKNGKKVAKLTGAKEEKVAAVKRLFGILPSDVTLEQARMERLND